MGLVPWLPERRRQPAATQFSPRSPGCKTQGSALVAQAPPSYSVYAVQCLIELLPLQHWHGCSGTEAIPSLASPSQQELRCWAGWWLRQTQHLPISWLPEAEWMMVGHPALSAVWGHCSREGETLTSILSCQSVQWPVMRTVWLIWDYFPTR